jgi:levanase/fructan beta-fructosidase
METISLGLATSPDMIHWKQQQVIVRPEAAYGAPGSGSTVVDIHNTSGLQTGKHPVFVTLFSGSASGVWVIYSNDLGRTWQRYPGNPVVVSPTFDPRDPHVFWHGPTRRWVMAIYGPGLGKTSFHTSPDLLAWTPASTLEGFGYECPDMYELAVDGDPSRKKWVLMKADGEYLLGEFDGVRFTPEPGGPYKAVLSADFYAAQSFFRDTFPDGRVIQIAWMGAWDTPLGTSPWSQNATFPVELGLKTFPEGIRLTRKPIAEIAKLHTAPQVKLSCQKFPGGTNMLANVKAKCFDLSAEFDFSQNPDNYVQFQLANRNFYFSHKTGRLFQHEFRRGTKLSVRILCDWSQLEVFAGDGEFSWSERFAFTPDGDHVCVRADKELEIRSLEFHALDSAWK